MVVSVDDEVGDGECGIFERGAVDEVDENKLALAVVIVDCDVVDRLQRLLVSGKQVSSALHPDHCRLAFYASFEGINEVAVDSESEIIIVGRNVAKEILEGCIIRGNDLAVEDAFSAVAGDPEIEAVGCEIGGQSERLELIERWQGLVSCEISHPNAHFFVVILLRKQR